MLTKQSHVLRFVSIHPIILTGCLVLELFYARNSLSQANLLQRQINSSVKNDFSYQIITTVGTRTTANVTGNLEAETEAILKLRGGSLVTNKIGDANGNASAVFTSTPNGGNVNLQGITGENLFVIEDGSSFTSKLRTVANPNPELNSTGDASATAVQSTTVKVESGTSTLINTFQQAF